MISEATYIKAQRLIVEIQQHREYIASLEYEIERLAEMYMEGMILEPVGKEQNRFKREINRQEKLITQKERELLKLRQKYNF